MNNSPKMTRQGVRDLNDLTPKPRRPPASQVDNAAARIRQLEIMLGAGEIRGFAQDAIKAHEAAGDSTAAAIWRFIITRYNREIDRLTVELASARKGDRT